MLSYLEKYKNLPADLRQKVSLPEVMQAISELEEKYNVNLASVVMRLMVKDLSIVDLEKYFVFENDLAPKDAADLIQEMKIKVFHEVADYLGFFPGEKNLVDSGGVIKEEGEEKASEKVVKGSNFFFSPEDEEEVKELAKKIDSFSHKSQPSHELEKKSSELAKQAEINFSSTDLASRFHQIMKTYFKGIRNRIDTRQVLARSINEGGLGLDANSIEKIIITADKLSSKPELQADKKTAEERFEKDEVKIVGGRDVGYDFSKLKRPLEHKTLETEVINKEKVQKEEKKDEWSRDWEVAIGENIGKVNLEEKPSSAPTDVEASGDKLGDVSAVKEISTASKGKQLEKTDLPVGFRQEAKQDKEKKGLRVLPQVENEKVVNIKRPILKEEKKAGGKVKIEDVKYIPKLTGPIDELAEMSLVNFRRLSSDASEAAKKIEEKISFLEEDGYAQRLAGIKAWRESPINKLYLDIGKESIESHKGIGEVLAEKQSNGGDSLTDREFSAIMNLNKSIRF